MSEKLLLRIDQYLDWNSLREDVICLESGLQMKKITRESVSEEKPTVRDTVLVHYQGQYMDGQEFDNSVEKNRPVSVKVSTLNEGLMEGIQYMNEGDAWEFYVHPKLGYGYEELDKLPGEVGIEANSVLIYSVKLFKIIRDGESEVDFDPNTLNMDKLFTNY